MKPGILRGIIVGAVGAIGMITLLEGLYKLIEGKNYWPYLAAGTVITAIIWFNRHKINN